MNEKEIISKAMSALGKKGAAKRKLDPEYIAKQKAASKKGLLARWGEKTIKQKLNAADKLSTE